MKPNKNELDVDFIGGSGLLTEEEEKAISKFIKSSTTKRKTKNTKSKNFKKK